MIKIWFFWTPILASRVLEDIFKSWGIDVKFIVTATDKPVWRWLNITFNPVKEFALDKNIALFQPEKIRWNTDFIEKIKSLEVDYFVVVAYSKIIPENILNIPKKMCINIHGSILPKYRWASPIQSALIEWETKTWVTIMKMDEAMDTGDIIDILEIPIDKFETSQTLFDKFGQVSGKFLVKTLIALDKWLIKPVKQDDNNATYCSKISKEDWLANFSKLAKTLFNSWKWLTPWPGLYTNFKDKKFIIEQCDFISSSVIPAPSVIPAKAGIYKNNKFQTWEVIKIEDKIWIICGDSSILILKKVKLEWKKSQEIKDFVNWYKDFVGYVFK
ncbi:MAG: hypothetical protein ACD_49C00051G0015 [uncultured bacterium (gcode 4)]|uniref:methionyl-tRNA formyltransferase n=1 Tax=uncultured bacterium (gcode 4) TaxID=1234023 RepID=K2AX62_9BACT|nr:MAG: hypothetical protein ACD_49C00051G0015 [uncultured bacterium (gcode 4)]